MPGEIGKLAGELLTSPEKVEIAPQSTTAERVAQRVVFVETARKRAMLSELFSDPAWTRTLVFTRTKHGADRVAAYLEAGGVEAAAIHGNKSQGQRERALQAFRDGRVRALVATDIAARGIDVDGVTHVVNFDLPNVAEAYVHRIGRTARAGADGRGGDALRRRRAQAAQGHRARSSASRSRRGIGARTRRSARSTPPSKRPSPPRSRPRPSGPRSTRTDSGKSSRPRRPPHRDRTHHGERGHGERGHGERTHAERPAGGERNRQPRTTWDPLASQALAGRLRRAPRRPAPSAPSAARSARTDRRASPRADAQPPPVSRQQGAMKV